MSQSTAESVDYQSLSLSNPFDRFIQPSFPGATSATSTTEVLASGSSGIDRVQQLKEEKNRMLERRANMIRNVRSGAVLYWSCFHLGDDRPFLPWLSTAKPAPGRHFCWSFTHFWRTSNGTTACESNATIFCFPSTVRNFCPNGILNEEASN